MGRCRCRGLKVVVLVMPQHEMCSHVDCNPTLTEPSAEECYSRREAVAAFFEAVANLHPTDRRILMSWFTGSFDDKQIAKELKIDLSRLRLARSAIAANLSAQLQEAGYLDCSI